MKKDIFTFWDYSISIELDLNWCKILKSLRVGSKVMIEIVIFLILSQEAKSRCACFMKL